MAVGFGGHTFASAAILPLKIEKEENYFNS